MKLEIFTALLLLPIGICRIVEKVETACNGPCGQLKPSCPEGQRVAVRDAVYRVQDQIQSCTPFPGCSDQKQSVCCDPSPKDCVFPYSPMHLKAVLRNCSGNQDCVIQTERSDVETVACSSSDPQNTSSQTALNYVCIDESKIADICSAQDAVVEGKTLFAMLDPHGVEKIPKGSVCTCMAESTRWPTTNSIAVFLVDLRLNQKKHKPCSKATLAMRSGNNVKKLNCASSQDPRVNFPFVAVLNDSNVATLRLEVSNHLPEFVWIGFEANEEENIRLTCKLQGVSPDHTTPTDAPTTEHGQGHGRDRGGGGSDRGGSGSGGDREDSSKENKNSNNMDNKGKDGDTTKTKTDQEVGGTEAKSKKTKGDGSNAGAGVAIGTTVALLLVLAIIVIALYVMRKRRRYRRSASLDEVDMDVYHSIDSTMDRSSFKARGGTGLSQAPQVGKRGRSNKRVRIISTPDLMGDRDLPEYTTAVEVRERKRTSQRPDLTQTRSNNYDHFSDDNNPKQSDLIFDSYDQLDCPPPYYSIDGVEGDLQERRGQSSQQQQQQQKLHGNVNETYEDTEGDMACTPPRNTQFLMEECGALYFELENDNPNYRESVAYESPPTCNPSASNPDCTSAKTAPSIIPSAPDLDSNSSAKTTSSPLSVSTSDDALQSSSSQSPPQSPTYNDAISLATESEATQAAYTNSEQLESSKTPDSDAAETETETDVNRRQSESSLSQTQQQQEEQGPEDTDTVADSKEEPEARKSFPIAAPRKLSLKESRSFCYEYDIAEPIEEL